MFWDLPIRILEAGGFGAAVIAALSLAAILWGIVNLVRRHGRSAVAGQLCASLLPAMTGLFCFCRYLLSYAVVAHSEVSPQAPVFHQIARQFLAAGFLSLTGTVVAVSLGVMGLFENRRAGVYAGYLCYGLATLLIGAGLSWGHWTRIFGTLQTGTLRWNVVWGDAVTRFGDLAVLVGGLLVVAGVRGLLVHRRTTETH